MGFLGARAMAEFGGVSEMTIRWHLTANCWPPFTDSFVTVMMPVIFDAIEKADNEEWDTVLSLPDTVQKGDSSTVTVGELIESLHLEAFLVVEGEDA